MYLAPRARARRAPTGRVLIGVFGLCAVSILVVIHGARISLFAPFRDEVHAAARRLPRGPWYTRSGDAMWYPTVWRQISKSPRAFYVEKMVSDSEAARIIAMATPMLARSAVVGQAGGNKVDTGRTSNGMFLTTVEQTKDPATRAIRSRAAWFFKLPEANIEAVQILRYEVGQTYRPHNDFFEARYTELLRRGGQRVATALIWLNDVSDGGATEFPLAYPRRIEVPPKKGDGVLWWNVDEKGKEDSHSQHGGMPPTNGTKWVAVMWLRAGAFF